MLIARRSLSLLALPGLLATPAVARAAEWPARPLRMVVPFTPGGSTDILGRVVASRIGAALGQPVVVENRPGAGGTVGTEQIAHAAADGYTIGMGHIGTLAVNPTLYPRLGYDPERGLAPICLVAMVANVLAVGPRTVPATSVAEFLAFARARRDPLSFGSGGNGSAAHLAMAALGDATGIGFTHVPYRGTAPMVTDMISGQIDMTMSGGPALLPPVRAGQLRALGVSTRGRIEAAPDLPAIAETLPGFEAAQWYGVVGPAGLPEPVVARLNAAIRGALGAPEVLARLRDEGAEPAPGTPAEFASFIGAEMQRWGGLIRRAGLKAD